MGVICYFLLLTFIVSWTAWGALIALTQANILQFGHPLTILGLVIGGISPGISGFVTRYKYGKPEFKDFLRSHIKFNLHIGWYIFLFLVPLVLTAVSWFYFAATSGTASGTAPPLLNQPVYMVIALLPLMVLGGGLEEIGWRGVLLPELIKKQSAFSAALLIGIIWLIWHLPLAFVIGSPQSTLNWGWYSLSVMTMSLVFAAFYLRTGSIGMCILLHALFNVYAGLVNSPPSNAWVDGAVKIILSLGVFFILMRGRKQPVA